jgi:predicted DNA binding CopG/RHH family protein
MSSPTLVGRSTDVVAMRLPHRDVDAIKRAAHERGLSVNAFLREVLGESLPQLSRT